MKRKLIQNVWLTTLVAVGCMMQNWAWAQQADKPASSAAKPIPSQAEEPAPPAAASVPIVPAATGEPAVPMYKYEAKGRRDPFRSLDVTSTVQAVAAPIVRPPGLKGQLVSEIKVVGIVKAKNGLMAMAEGYRHKTFFIHPSDALYDGKVVEIRRDAVVFQQTLTDNLGKKISQQVIKKLYPTRGEGNNEK